MIVYDYDPKAARRRKKRRMRKPTLPEFRHPKLSIPAPRQALLAGGAVVAVLLVAVIIMLWPRPASQTNEVASGIPEGMERIAPSGVYASAEAAKARRPIKLSVVAPKDWEVQPTRSNVTALDPSDHIVAALRMSPTVDGQPSAQAADSLLIVENVSAWLQKDDTPPARGAVAPKAKEKQDYLAFLQALKKRQDVGATSLAKYEGLIGYKKLQQARYAHSADSRFSGFTAVASGVTDSQLVVRLAGEVGGEPLYLRADIGLPDDEAERKQVMDAAIKLIESMAINSSGAVPNTPAIGQ